MIEKIDLAQLLEEYLEDANGHLDEVERTLMELEGDDSGTDGRGLLTLIMGHLHTLKGNSGMMGFGALQKYLHTLEEILKPVVEGSQVLGARLAEVLYTAINSLRDGLRKLAENPDEPPDFTAEQFFLDSFDAPEWQAAGDEPFMGDKLVNMSSLTSKSATLKVNFGKLDELMNLVGELVIHRTALTAVEARLKETVCDRALLDAFDASSQAIAKTANELREAVMKVRMLPIRTVFQRFTRLVRDLSREHGKEIRLLFQGEETELDKTVIDEIGEPLLHLLRNAVDHGIESTEERRRAGKPARGTLTLSACHESSHIVISLRDDGRGIDAERLRQSALLKGLIEERAAAALPEQETLQLMFLPGFSTASVVTETSGRGIGLDVVKKIVAGFNGIIEVDSRPGEGSCFTMRLPLTLAIIHALMVQVGSETFAIPLSGVLESIKINSAEIHQVAAGEIIRLRDRLLPLVRVAERFGIERSTTGDSEYVVVVGSGEKRAGLVVDRLVGQQEVVIKALDDYLGVLPGIAGGTVLGDGRVSMILDIAGLVGGAR